MMDPHSKINASPGAGVARKARATWGYHAQQVCSRFPPRASVEDTNRMIYTNKPVPRRPKALNAVNTGMVRVAAHPMRPLLQCSITMEGALVDVE